MLVTPPPPATRGRQPPPRDQRQAASPFSTRGRSPSRNRQPPPPAQRMLGDTSNKRAVRILLECNLLFALSLVKSHHRSLRIWKLHAGQCLRHVSADYHWTLYLCWLLVNKLCIFFQLSTFVIYLMFRQAMININETNQSEHHTS